MKPRKGTCPISKEDEISASFLQIMTLFQTKIRHFPIYRPPPPPPLLVNLYRFPDLAFQSCTLFEAIWFVKIKPPYSFPPENENDFICASDSLKMSYPTADQKAKPPSISEQKTKPHLTLDQKAKPTRNGKIFDPISNPITYKIM